MSYGIAFYRTLAVSFLLILRILWVGSWERDNFSVKSTYDGLTCNDSGLLFKWIWKGKIPAKIKFLLWLVKNNAILTKDNMIERNWKGDPLCFFCKQPENVVHLLYTCSVAKIVWFVVAIIVGTSDIPRSP